MKAISQPIAARSALAALCLCASAGVSSADPAWLVGTWTGTGSQAGTQTHWSILLTVQPQAGANAYKIDYPSLDCGGYWTLNDASAAKASFIEHITYGRDKCVDLGTITIAPNGAGLTFQWTGTQPSGATDTADAVLARK